MHSLNRSFLTLSLVFAALLIALASCAKKDTTTSAEPAAAAPAESAPADTASAASATAPAPAPSVAVAPAGIATADGETAGVTATIKELKRASGGTISLKLVITNGSDKQLDTGYAFVDPDNSGLDYNSIGGVQLIDPVGKKKYFVARDAEKKCVCSQGIKGIKPGASINVWAKFPAPPLDVQKISVIIPHFSPMDDVPISGE
jgi:hypothetical protein